MDDLVTVERHPGRIVLRTPSEPEYWFGNCTILRTAGGDADMLFSQFQADHPKSRHVTLQWDLPGMARTDFHDRLADRGFEIDARDVLVLGPSRRNPPAPDGIMIRPISGAADWEKVAALQWETRMEEAEDPAIYATFIRSRIAAWRGQVDRGRGCWFGAFDGETLAGDLGIFATGPVARFQSVETRSRYRRRGICASLVRAGIGWAAGRAPASRPVIVADRKSPAGRIYRGCGFRLAETLISALRRPDPAARPRVGAR